MVWESSQLLTQTSLLCRSQKWHKDFWTHFSNPCTLCPEKN